MHVLPIFMPRSEAMEVMRNLRVNQSWLILPASVVLIGFGAPRSGRRVMTFFLNLGEKSAAAVESERRYALAIAGTDAGIWDWNLNTGEIFRSRRWHDMLGYAGTEVESRVEAHLDLLHPDDLSIARLRCGRIWRTTIGMTSNFGFVTKRVITCGRMLAAKRFGTLLAPQCAWRGQ